MARTVGFPATPSFGKMLQNRLGFILLDSLGHHVENVVHDCGSKLEIKVRFNPLLGDGLCDTVRTRESA